MLSSQGILPPLIFAKKWNYEGKCEYDGGIGIVLNARIYSIFTRWGFFKVKWVGIKWVLTVVLVLIGKVYMGVTIERNMDYAAMMLAEPLPAEPFLANVRNVAIAGIVQLVGFAAIAALPGC